MFSCPLLYDKKIARKKNVLRKKNVKLLDLQHTRRVDGDLLQAEITPEKYFRMDFLPCIP